MEKDLDTMTSAELKKALSDNQALLKRIQAAIDKKAKASEAFRPGDKLEVGANGDIKLVESAEQKRVRESAVRAFMDLGLPRAAAERAADRGEAA